MVSGPNVAVLNSGDVDQNSGNNVDASNTNTANQSNTQQNGAGQSQTVAGNGCCSSEGASQSASQSNEGSNEANQSGTSAPVVVSGPNVAVLNKGDVNQNSGNNVDASNTNTANQSNTQQNGAGQSQTVAGTNGCCHSGGASQSADQSNSGSNTANQSGYSAPVVTSGPNIAVGNGWVHDACNPCAPAGGGVNQNSGNRVDASNHNTATQSNNQSNGLGQAQWVSGSNGGCCGTGDVSQSATQSNSGSNTANQSGTSAPYVTSGGNLAALNGGAVNQNSGNWVDASNHNTATQRNNQSNGLGQSQTVSGAGSGCCGAGDVSQSATQSNWAENTANQSGRSTPVVTSGHNVAFANAGPINQNSGNWVDASNHNTATQSNNQSNGLGQSQTVSGAGSGCCGAGDVSQSADQSNSAENTADQSGYSAPVVTSGHNMAFLDHGGPRQNSGNVVNASNHNTAGQSNNQSNSLGQHQSVNRGGCCPPAPCEPSCEPKCPPEPCEPRCPPNPCEHECEPRCEPNPCAPVLTSPRGGLGVI